MNITIFGATGTAGLLVTRKALDDGHEVTVYARNPSKLNMRSDRLTIVQGELADHAAIAASIAGREAVLSVLGPRPGAAGSPVTAGTRSIVSAMQAHGVRRLIATSTPSWGDPNDRPSFSFSLAVRAIRTLQRAAYDDVVGAAAVVHQSALDWTLVRLPMLTNKPGVPPALAGYVGSPGLRLFWLSRDVMADFLVGQLADRSWIQKAPLLSNRR
ncbi:MAG TPA: NAD(P)H-binding protein [Polyangiales bacterium]|nr:NAD(P)H-binding protein [Polyangiales bacterium]